MINNLTNIKLLRELDLVIEGHTEAKKQLIDIISRIKMKYYKEHVMGLKTPIEHSRALVIGKSGTGKSHLIKAMSEIMGFPLIYLDATLLNPSGSDRSNMKVEYIDEKVFKNAAELQLSSIEGTVAQTVVFIDEFDKIATNKYDSSGYWLDRVQVNLLTLLDNAPYNFIFAGAFNKLLNNNTQRPSLGFYTKQSSSDKDVQISDVDDQKLIDYGLMPELVGRISDIVLFDEVDIETYRKILMNTLWPLKQEELAIFEIYDAVLPPESVISQICLKARESGQGVRALKRLFDAQFKHIFFNYEETFDEPRRA